MGNNNNNSNNESSNSSSYYNNGQMSNTDDGLTYLSDIQSKSTIRVGPFGIDPLHYTEFVITCLAFWMLYLLIPRGYRFTYFGSYPKRYSWSSRTKRRRMRRAGGAAGLPYYNNQVRNNGHHSGASVISAADSVSTMSMNTNHRELPAQGIGTSNANLSANPHLQNSGLLNRNHSHLPESVPEDEEIVDFLSPPVRSNIHRGGNNFNTPIQTIHQNSPWSSNAKNEFNDEIAISTTMQQLRDTGIQIIAHGSKGKPKSVRLVLSENAIEWRTESSKKKGKVGKNHRVPLTHIMYVDVGKQTTALRRVENAAIPENLCLSLLTKEGSLDLEASSAMERDALVNCFSMVLDEVHAQNWRDIYRAPSSDMPSSFDDFDFTGGQASGRMEV